MAFDSSSVPEVTDTARAALSVVRLRLRDWRVILSRIDETEESGSEPIEGCCYCRFDAGPVMDVLQECFVFDQGFLSKLREKGRSRPQDGEGALRQAC
jgi:hypothetical protein